MLDNTHDLPEIIIITNEEAGERLDKVLANRFEKYYSRAYFQSLIAQQLVSLNGQFVKKKTIPLVGDEIEVHFTAGLESEIKPEQIPLDIVYEDNCIIVVNKPVGMVVH